MEILSKSEKYNNSKNEHCKNNNIFSEDNYKYIFNLKMNKIKEEIKDYIIDKYTKKIIEQNKEIIHIKNQLEELTKKYINIIKLMIENKNKVNINTLDNINYINNIINKNELLFNNNNSYKKIISNKVNKEEKDKKQIFFNNLEKIINNNIDININPYEKKRNKIYNLKTNNMNYLKELNKKDLKKLNSIKVEIKKAKASKDILNNENNSDINKIMNIKNDFKYKKIPNVINLKNNSKIKINKNRNKKNENIIINYLTINTDDKKLNKKKFSFRMNSTVKNKFFKINTNFNNYSISKSIENNKIEKNEITNSTEKKYYKSKFNNFKKLFYKFGKINSSFNDSFKQNSIENQNQNLLNNTVQSKYDCNPVFSSFLDRIDNN